MEDVAAVKVILSGGVERFFITWGRIQNIVDPSELESLILGAHKDAQWEGNRSELRSATRFERQVVSALSIEHLSSSPKTRFPSERRTKSSEM